MILKGIYNFFKEKITWKKAITQNNIENIETVEDSEIVLCDDCGRLHKKKDTVILCNDCYYDYYKEE